MMTKLSDMARLKELLMGMEKDLGLEDLGIVHKDIIYAATMVIDEQSQFETDAVRQHPLLYGVSRSSFFRALKDLVAAGHIKHQSGSYRSSYLLVKK
jgi:hypothetical protein